MATTTNYGWTTPDDTALVKDGAAAIRTLGSSVDTTTKALNPSTTLGDIEYRSSTANTNTRLGIGSTGQVLTVTGGVPTWATPAAGSSFVGVRVYQSASQSLSNATFTTITFGSENFDTDAFHSTVSNTSRLTVPTGKAGKYYVYAQLAYNGNSTGQRQAEITVNGSGGYAKTVELNNGSSYITTPITSTVITLAVGDYVELGGYQDSGTTLTNQDGSGYTWFGMTYLGA